MFVVEGKAGKFENEFFKDYIANSKYPLDKALEWIKDNLTPAQIYGEDIEVEGIDFDSMIRQFDRRIVRDWIRDNVDVDIEIDY